MRLDIPPAVRNIVRILFLRTSYRNNLRLRSSCRFWGSSYWLSCCRRLYRFLLLVTNARVRPWGQSGIMVPAEVESARIVIDRSPCLCSVCTWEYPNLLPVRIAASGAWYGLSRSASYVRLKNRNWNGANPSRRAGFTKRKKSARKLTTRNIRICKIKIPRR
jgi:hypothetical protein